MAEVKKNKDLRIKLEGIGIGQHNHHNVRNISSTMAEAIETKSSDSIPISSSIIIK